MPKRILFINQEITPYVSANEVAKQGQLLPEKFQELGYEIRTFMPKWGTINERRGQLHEVIRLSGLNICIDGSDHPLLIKVASIPVSRVQVYFIDNEDYFNKRRGVTDAKNIEYSDNGERAIFFARGVLETMKKLRWAPDVVVCQGWMSAVAPLYLRTVFAEEPCFANVKIVSTLFPSNIKNGFGTNFKRCIEFQDLTVERLSAYNDDFTMNELAKLAVDYSDAVALPATNAPAGIVEYVKQKNMPIIEFDETDLTRNYEQLFDELTK